jgi:hypothetical protein
MLILLAQITSTDYTPYLTSVRAQLVDLFNKYDNKFNVVRMLIPSNVVPT